jgi:DNA-binding transcriptional regulator LsrR (DeoR family)
MGVCKQMTINLIRYRKAKEAGIVEVTIRMTVEEKAKLDKAVRLSGQTQQAFINDALYTQIGDLTREREYDRQGIT